MKKRVAKKVWRNLMEGARTYRKHTRWRAFWKGPAPVARWLMEQDREIVRVIIES